MRVLAIAIMLLLLPVWASAAYQNPVVIANEPKADGRIKLVFEFKGNAGEPTVTKDFIVQPSTTATIVRNWIYTTIAELDLMNTAATLPALQPGQTVTRLAPVAPTPSACAVWKRKVEQYTQVAGNAFTGTIATELAALKSDIESTYPAGCITQ